MLFFKCRLLIFKACKRFFTGFFYVSQAYKIFSFVKNEKHDFSLNFDLQANKGMMKNEHE